jgi:hypothetical protein
LGNHGDIPALTSHREERSTVTWTVEDNAVLTQVGPGTPVGERLATSDRGVVMYCEVLTREVERM